MARSVPLEKAGQVAPVVIGSSYNAYGVIRGFAEEGIRSILITGGAKCFVQFSKYLERHVVLPSAKEDPAGFVAGLEALGRELSPRKGMLFPTHDEQLEAITQCAGTLAPYYELPFSSHEVCCQIMDKDALRAKCEELGIPTIQQRLVHSMEEAEDCAGALPFPLIIKANSPDSRMNEVYGTKTRLSETPEDYRSFCADFFGQLPGEELLVQEYIADSDQLMPNVNTLTDREGNMRCVFVSEKVRQHPPKTGTSIATNSMDPEDPKYAPVIEYTAKLLKAFGFYGLSGTEYKYDPATGLFKIIETNPRSEFPNYLQTMVGQNMAYQLYRYHLGLSMDLPYYPVLKQGQCVVPFNDYFYTRHLYKRTCPEAALSRRERRATLLKPTTGYGLTSRDWKPFCYAYWKSAVWGLNAYIRARLGIPQHISTARYLMGAR